MSRWVGAMSRPEAWAALLLFLVLAPQSPKSPPWGDGVEFTATSTIMGVGHPTGYPLYSIVAKAATSLPFSNPARKMNLLSAASMALAGALMASCVWLLAGGRQRRPGDAAWCASVATPLFALLGPTGFELGSTTEAYAAHLAFQFGILRVALALSPLRLASDAAAAAGGARQIVPARAGVVRLILFGAFLSGLSLTHHRMALFPIFAFGVAALWRLKAIASQSLGRAAGVVAGALLLFALGLTPILYLPIRAAANPPINWGAPDSLDRLAWTLKGGEFIEHRFLQYRPGQPLSFDDPELLRQHVGERFALARDWAGAQLLPSMAGGGWAMAAAGLVALGLAVVGMGALWRRRPLALFCLLATIGGAFALPFVYNIADPEGYFLAWWSAGWLLAGIGVAAAASAAEFWFAGRSVRWVWLALALPGLAMGRASALERPYALAEAGLPGDLIARASNLTDHYAWRLLDFLPPNAVLVTTGDADIYAAWNGQLTLGLRPDVLPIGINFLRMESYQRQMDAHPARLPGLRTGAELPKSAREAAFLLMDRVVEPAKAAGRQVLISCDDPALLEGLSLWGKPRPMGQVLTPEELLAVRIVYPVASAPNHLYLLSRE
jgi:hypothetical protein